MAASLSDIQGWVNRAAKSRETGARTRWVIVVCDTIDWSDYPLYIDEDQDIHEQLGFQYDKSAVKVMEVYDLVGGDPSTWWTKRRVWEA